MPDLLQLLQKPPQLIVFIIISFAVSLVISKLKILIDIIPGGTQVTRFIAVMELILTLVMAILLLHTFFSYEMAAETYSKTSPFAFLGLFLLIFIISVGIFFLGAALDKYLFGDRPTR